MIVDNDVDPIDNDTQEKKNKIVFSQFLWKVATLYTWHWKNGFNEKRRYGFVSIFNFLSQEKEKIFKYWYNWVEKCDFVFLYCKSQLYGFGFWTIKNFWIQPWRLYLVSRLQPNNYPQRELYRYHFWKDFQSIIGNKKPNLMCGNNKNY